MQQTAKQAFSRRHPILFAMLLILAAVALFLGASALLRVLFANGEMFSEQRIGVVNVQGALLDTTAHVEFVETLRADNSVVGVLLRVDSPGGAVAPSQELHDAVRRLADQKPVVVSMGAAAASGGYYISAPATLIVANPATITASIGVKMELGNVRDLLDSVGIQYVAMTSGRLKNAGSPFGKEMTPEESEYLQSIIMDMYEQFLQAVAEGRDMDIEAVRAVADGRAMTGRQAHDAGLVDMLGDRHVAMGELFRLCNVTDSLPLKEGPVEKRSFFQELFMSMMPQDFLWRADGSRYRFFF